MTQEALSRLLAELARDTFKTGIRSDEGSFWDVSLWGKTTEAGLLALDLDEDHLDGETPTSLGAAVLYEAGGAAAPIPVMESGFVYGWLRALSGGRLPSLGSAPAIAVLGGDGVALEQRGSVATLSGSLDRVPWASVAEQLAVVTWSRAGEEVLVSVSADQARIRQGRNVAGEPRDSVQFDHVVVERLLDVPTGLAKALLLRAALGRALLLTGACQRVFDDTITYANTREQFGRPIAKQQALRHQIAEMAASTSAARAACDAAVHLWTGTEFDSPLLELAVAAAKSQASRSGGTVSRLAHQVHGAMGFTREYPLRHFTTRLWAWRDEDGDEHHWHRVLGRLAMAPEAKNLWSMLTEAG